MIGRFLRQQMGGVLLLLACTGIFAAVLYVYALPMEPVVYAFVLCLLLLLVVMGVRVVRFVRAHQARKHVLSAPQLLLEQMPEAQTQAEQDDVAIMQVLHRQLGEAQSALHHYQQDSTDYFTAWVHQIKTPLSVMRLQLQSEDTPEHRALLMELFQMEQYVNMALSYTRLQHPTKDLVLVKTPVDAVIRQCIREFAPLLIRRHIGIQYEGTQESAVTDAKWLSFMLGQVMSNAAKYTGEGGSVRIQVKAGPVVEIADTGIGIAPEDVPRVFEKGYTGYNGHSGQKSTGLGLYLVHQTAQMLGVQVSLTSCVGKGTCVTLDLRQKEVGKQ